eukprot:COSAG01_NODE_3165_length_6476_cov_31.556845_7_plen_131_part_00
MSRKKDQNGISYPRMTLIGILEFEKGTKLEYSDPNWNSWGWKALIGISPKMKRGQNVSSYGAESRTDVMEALEVGQARVITAEKYRRQAPWNDHAGTRTLNLLLRRQTPYPLGHAVRQATMVRVRIRACY